MKQYAVEVNDVSMTFNLGREKVDSLKEYMIKMLKKDLSFEEFSALKEVSFKVEKGDSFAILGKNGSGKSTVLKIIAGIYKPSSGKVTVNGTIAPLIELGAGFDMELTANENIYLNGAVLGYSKKFIQNKYEEIIEFSELQEFADVPLKNYSSGMVARLGFSIATLVKPEILIVDEILSVGDFEFQQKCERKMNEMINAGTTLILVSHSIDQVKSICKNAVWINKGEVVITGDVNTVCNAYTSGI